MAKLYGWGASVVILGALFKINHYPGANEMLIAGLGTEAIIFFFSAFEPPFVEPDWSMVYPELAGLYHGDSSQSKTKKKPVDELDDMLKKANIDQQLIQRLGEGFTKLSDTTSKMSDLSNAASANNEFVANVKNASKSVETLSKSYTLTSETLQKDANASSQYVTSLKSAADSAVSLSTSYKEASETMKSDVNATKEFTSSLKTAMQSANSLAQQYTLSAETLSKSAKMLDFSAVDGKSYNDQLQKIANNLSALNSVYELQMQSSNEQINASSKVNATMAEMLKNLKESSDMMGTYREQMNLLTQRITALNEIYGGMLSAMNIRAK
jgi:gliding motility-associated protein GldL